MSFCGGKASFFYRKCVDKQNQSAIIAITKEKPMIKKSTLSERFSESSGWWDRSSRWKGEWA